ncbi:hypothetical protein IAQ61_009779 [Plenodomus lingam]|uniref:uncharacterized protein n=1 Tax=Leptosphaeria maculans TaxID=5022 RepID=UPI003316B9D9|nr:hypothetical protein IAQ61_009779 [Plenodomus lingam]
MGTSSDGTELAQCSVFRLEQRGGSMGASVRVARAAKVVNYTEETPPGRYAFSGCWASLGIRHGPWPLYFSKRAQHSIRKYRCPHRSERTRELWGTTVAKKPRPV